MTDNRRYMQAKTHQEAEDWDEETPTGTRVPRKLKGVNAKTQRSKNNG